MPTTAKILFTMVVAFIFGAVMLAAAIPRLAVSGAPIVPGTIVDRAPSTEWGVPRAHFTIQVDGSPDVVDAYTQRYLLDRIPEKVRFHYSGDPARLVYLVEHEEDPLWIGLVCWAGAACLGGVLYCRCRSSAPVPK